MNKIYVGLFLCAVIVAAFYCGSKIADAKCRMQIAQESLQNSEQQRKQDFYNKKVLHETVYKTGVADIRRILQSKYTIAE